MFRNKGNAPLWNFRMNSTSQPWFPKQWLKKTTYCIGVFCLTERLFYILNRMWDLGHFLCEKMSEKSKVVSKPDPEPIDCMSPVPYTWCPSADNCVINSWACYICSKVPTHARLTARQLCSLLLLGLWEIITGNQLADRSFKSYAAAADKHPQVFFQPVAPAFCHPKAGSRCFKRNQRQWKTRTIWARVCSITQSHCLWPILQKRDLLNLHPASRRHVNPKCDVLKTSL